MKSFQVVLLLITIGSTLLWAQPAKPRQFVEAGLLIGASAYGGDLRSEDVFFLDQAGFGGGAGIRYHLGGNIALRANVLRSLLQATDAKDIPQRQERGFSFETQLTELALQAEWHPLGHRRYQGDWFRPVWSPYFFAGAGLGMLNARPDFNGRDSPQIRGDRNAEEDVLLVVPIGLGLRIDLSERTALGFEYGYRLTRSDYLDGISQAGNPGGDDRYGVASIQVWRRFGRSDLDRDGIADAIDACPESKGGRATAGCPDRDGDGVADREDACPDVAGITTLAGCPDADNDGITDLRDRCPNLPGAWTTRGCPDRDGDSVPDREDDCPDDQGPAALSGCPDTDRDGVADIEDRCPDQVGSRSLLGCPDTDGDGLGDGEDRCPTEPGLNMFQGCPDTDGDGLADWEDSCPTQVGLRANRGCPEIEAADQEVLEFAARNIQFESGSARIRSASFPILDQVADILLRYPDFRVAIEGHTDSTGDEQTNETLSRNRAKAAYDYLVTRGISADRLSYAGYGESRPVASNSTAAGRQRNRRVVFELTPGS